MFRIVVRMDGYVIAWNAGCYHGFNGLGYVFWKRATVGVAQDDPARACFISGLAAFQRIVRVGLEAVEEMLGVIKRLATQRFQVFKRTFDVLDIFLKRDPQCCGDVEIVAFAHQTNRWRIRVNHCRQHIIISSRAPCPFGHPKRRKRGSVQLRRGREEVIVRGVSPGPAALNIINAKIIERLCNAGFILSREIHAVGLLAIPKGRVVEVEALFGHFKFSSLAGSNLETSSILACGPSPVARTLTPMLSSTFFIRSASS